VRDITGNRPVPITRSPFTIGRRDTNALRLGSAEVSREHAQIIVEDNHYLLRDLGSRFGTFVNGVRITEQELQAGDRIRLGRDAGSDMVFDLGVGDLSGSFSGGTPSNPVSDVRQVAILLESLRALGHARVLPEVLALVLDSAITLSGAERGFIMLAAPGGGLEFKLARGQGRKTLDDATFQTSRKIPEAAFTTGRVQVVRDLLEGEAAGEHPETAAFGIRHVLCAPLHLVRFVDAGDAHPDDRRLGVLYLDSHQGGALLSDSVRSGLETLAAEAAVAIENARLYREAAEKARIEQELRIAAEIQHVLLPQDPIDKPCVEAFARSLPCRSIGGDFFDTPIRKTADLHSPLAMWRGRARRRRS
jgi:pSer/pThr/pTyr-binding forkhead associated (FHA) protein